MILLPNSRRSFFAFAHDVAMAALSFALSFYLRVGDDFLRFDPRLTILYGVSFTAVAAVVFLVTGLYRGIWRYASLPDLFNIARAATLTVLIFLPAMFLVTRLETFPRSTLFINWLVLIALLGGPRLGYRLFKDRGLDHILERHRGPQIVPVLLISARDGADTFIRETMRDPSAVYRVVGMLADSESRVGRQIYGVPVLGTIDELETVVRRLDRRGRRPQKLIVTPQGLDGAAIRGLLDRADALAIPLARLPRATELRQGLDDIAAIEPIAIEDLLGRPQAVLDREAMARLIRGRRILVTGAGGTIGSELARQLAAYEPARLILLDNGEYLLYTIDAELRERFAGLTALSVEIWTTRSAPCARAASATLRLPTTLVSTPSTGLCSTIGTCLSAAAWNTTSGRSAASTSPTRRGSRTSPSSGATGWPGKRSRSSRSIV